MKKSSLPRLESVPDYMKPVYEKQEKRERLLAVLKKYTQKSFPSFAHVHAFWYAHAELQKDAVSNEFLLHIPDKQRKKILALREEAERNLAKVAEIWIARLDSLLSTLESGDDGPFFAALALHGGSLIFDPRIIPMIEAKILSAVVDKKDRAFLVKLGKKICFVGRGPMLQLDLEAQDKATLSRRSKSAAVTRLMKKYDKWSQPPFNLSPEDSQRQVKMDFRETTKLPPSLQDEVLASFRKKITDSMDGEK